MKYNILLCLLIVFINFSILNCSDVTSDDVTTSEATNDDSTDVTTTNVSDDSTTTVSEDSTTTNVTDDSTTTVSDHSTNTNVSDDSTATSATTDVTKSSESTEADSESKKDENAAVANSGVHSNINEQQLPLPPQMINCEKPLGEFSSCCDHLPKQLLNEEDIKTCSATGNPSIPCITSCVFKNKLLWNGQQMDSTNINNYLKNNLDSKWHEILELVVSTSMSELNALPHVNNKEDECSPLPKIFLNFVLRFFALNCPKNKPSETYDINYCNSKTEEISKCGPWVLSDIQTSPLASNLIPSFQEMDCTAAFSKAFKCCQDFKSIISEDKFIDCEKTYTASASSSLNLYNQLCIVECVFTKKDWLLNGIINEEKMKTDLTDDKEISEQCISKYKEPMQAEQTKCKSNSLNIANCIHVQKFMKCPEEKKIKDEECVKVMKTLETCTPEMLLPKSVLPSVNPNKDSISTSTKSPQEKTIHKHKSSGTGLLGGFLMNAAGSATGTLVGGLIANKLFGGGKSQGGSPPVLNGMNPGLGNGMSQGWPGNYNQQGGTGGLNGMSQGRPGINNQWGGGGNLNGMPSNNNPWGGNNNGYQNIGGQQVHNYGSNSNNRPLSGQSTGPRKTFADVGKQVIDTNKQEKTQKKAEKKAAKKAAKAERKAANKRKGLFGISGRRGGGKRG